MCVCYSLFFSAQKNDNGFLFLVVPGNNLFINVTDHYSTGCAVWWNVKLLQSCRFFAMKRVNPQYFTICRLLHSHHRSPLIASSLWNRWYFAVYLYLKGSKSHKKRIETLYRNPTKPLRSPEIPYRNTRNIVFLRTKNHPNGQKASHPRLCQFLDYGLHFSAQELQSFLREFLGRKLLEHLCHDQSI